MILAAVVSLLALLGLTVQATLDLASNVVFNVDGDKNKYLDLEDSFYKNHQLIAVQKIGSNTSTLIEMPKLIHPYNKYSHSLMFWPRNVTEIGKD